MAKFLPRLNKRQGRALFGLLVLVISVLLGVSAERVEEVLGTFSETQPGMYRVVKVNDGDTITVDMNGVQERVRLIGVDTPEKNHPELPVQCFAEAASRFTAELIGDNDVRLEADSSNRNRDRYDRLLRYVYLPDNTLVNAKIIEEGYGFAYLNFPFNKSTEFENYELEAMQNQKGLWSDCTIEEDEFGPQTNPADQSQPVVHWPNGLVQLGTSAS